MTLILNEPWVTDELARAIPTSVGLNDISIGRLVDERLVGGVLYKDYTRASMRMSVAGLQPNWLSRELLYEAFRYPFEQLKLDCVWSGIRGDKPEVIAFNLKLGFRYVTEIPGIYPGNTPVVITQMKRDQCRWLRLRQRLAARIA